MHPPKLIERIALAQKERGFVLEEIINDFTPLIKKYSFKLGYEDSKADLQLDFIDLICSFKVKSFTPNDDPYVLAYIEKTMRNSYIRHSKTEMHYRSHCTLFGELTENQKDLVDETVASCDWYNEVDTRQLLKYLTGRQFKVIHSLFYLCV